MVVYCWSLVRIAVTTTMVIIAVYITTKNDYDKLLFNKQPTKQQTRNCVLFVSSLTFIGFLLMLSMFVFLLCIVAYLLVAAIVHCCLSTAVHHCVIYMKENTQQTADFAWQSPVSSLIL